MNTIYILGQTDLNEAPSQITSGPSSQETMTKTGTPADSNTTPRQQSPFNPSQLIFIGLLILVMYMLLFRGPRKRQQEQQKMIMSLKKNDRVRTIGGIIGTITDIKDDEITLKVDESNNTKIKVLPSAIGKNISEGK